VFPVHLTLPTTTFCNTISSIHQIICPSASIHPSIYPITAYIQYVGHIYLSICLSFQLSVHLYPILHACFHPFNYLSNLLVIHPSIHLIIYVGYVWYIRPSVWMSSQWSSVSIYLHVCFHPSIHSFIKSNHLQSNQKLCRHLISFLTFFCLFVYWVQDTIVHLCKWGQQNKVNIF